MHFRGERFLDPEHGEASGGFGVPAFPHQTRHQLHQLKNINKHHQIIGMNTPSTDIIDDKELMIQYAATEYQTLSLSFDINNQSSQYTSTFMNNQKRQSVFQWSIKHYIAHNNN